MISFSHPYVSVLLAFITVTLVLLVVGTAWLQAALWGAVAAAFMLVGSHPVRRADEL